MPASSTTLASTRTSNKRDNHYSFGGAGTQCSSDSQSLQEYRISNYGRETFCPIMASSESAAQISAAHTTRVHQEIRKSMKLFNRQ